MGESEQSAERKFAGLGVSNGTACGKAFVVIRSIGMVPMYQISASQFDGEIRRFEQAIMKARQDICYLKEELSQKIGGDEASIFDAHLLVLEDIAIINEVYAMMRAKSINIEACYKQVVERFVQAFDEIDDPFMKERVADIKDVSRRVLNNLMGHEEKSAFSLGEPVILVSTDFTPSDFAMVDKTKVLGIVTERGSMTSHTAILARSLRVPCIVGVKLDEAGIERDTQLLIDGYKGYIYKNPSQETLKKYTEIASIHREIEKIFDSSLPYEAETTDGHKVALCINISKASDIPLGTKNFTDGVGLFRTENFFMDKGDFPDEETQFEAYKEAAIRSNGKPLVIRTMDLGGDKTLPKVKEICQEENPFMGYRAIRFCLDRVDIFTQQLRAILRASAFGNVKVLYPMISGINELMRANDVLEQAKLALRNEGKPFDENIGVGIMIEVPSAAMIIDILAKRCNFLSIGTNDLIQYLLAVDRVNDHVAHLYNPGNPAVIRTLNKIIKDGKAAGLRVSVCGEIAADPLFALLLIGMGIDSLSMSLSAISEIKFLLRKVSFPDLQKLAEEALKQNRSRDALAILRHFRNELMKKYIRI